MKSEMLWCCLAALIFVGHATVVDRQSQDIVVVPSAVCIGPPLCDDNSASTITKTWCRLGRDPIDRSSQEYRDMAFARLSSLLRRNVKGQDHIVGRIERDVRRKLLHPSEPLVMHFAGDNGVGKTSVAELISAATSFRCHKGAIKRTACRQGEELLSISGTTYHGVSVADFRHQVVGAVLEHARKFPYGVVVLNDMSALDPILAQVLLPLLGRSAMFPEDPSVDLRKLIVVVTTDFGQQGRTRGKDLAEVQLLVEAEVRSVYGHLAGSMLRTYPFLPASLQSAAAIASLALEDWGCAHNVASMTVEADVVGRLLDQCVDRVAFENGRAVVLHVEPLIAALSWGAGDISGAHVTVAVDLHGELVLSSIVSDRTEL